VATSTDDVLESDKYLSLPEAILENLFKGHNTNFANQIVEKVEAVGSTVPNRQESL